MKDELSNMQDFYLKMVHETATEVAVAKEQEYKQRRVRLS